LDMSWSAMSINMLVGLEQRRFINVQQKRDLTPGLKPSVLRER